MFRKLKNVGPGAMVAAAFIGPGTVTTATIAGSSHGFTLLWAIVFSIVATYLLQEMSARLGVVGRMGVGEAIRKKIDNKVLKVLASFLVIGAILIGNAAYEAGNITGAVLGFGDYGRGLSDFPINPLVLAIGLFVFLLLYSGKYKVIERFLIVTVSVMGLVFLFSAILLKPDLGQIFKAIFIPTLPKGSLLMVIGLIGTTVVPYNLFLHASSVKQRWSGSEHLPASRSDTLISVVLGGIITMAILVTSAVAFEGNNQAVNKFSDLSVQLSPALGSWSSHFISLGFLAAGLSSSITAALAAAFATSEILGWEHNLKGKKFRMTWLFVLLIGIIFSSLGFKPTRLILFSQVTNGLLLPIVALFLLWIMNDKGIMSQNANSKWANILGIIVIGIAAVLGIKGVLSGVNFF
ncbi:Nramp family divalent metal transporter [Xanthovirga aplysinae]|uniref:Nramp family divalent metal transporter n=1 Tax=Xanthovirga aplysinae TaxID=2529853 RepID=UPI0012BD6F2A|nr:Nramp family divalent metal transporter [Xanthovirga aplysinae]MTI30762.1 divalent metal cation transporter [Xanthovirga aplysinae]